MNKIIILSFLFIGCSTSSSKTSQVENQEDSIVVNFKSSPLEVIENEIIQKPSSPNVYLKRALYYQA
jgi:PBP1b-binding outer membrane lipoprotein LpoB